MLQQQQDRLQQTVAQDETADAQELAMVDDTEADPVAGAAAAAVQPVDEDSAKENTAPAAGLLAKTQADAHCKLAIQVRMRVCQ